MTKKLSKRDAAKLLNFSPITVQRLAVVATSSLDKPPDFDVWCRDEYTEQDNILFRLFVELKSILLDSSAVFIALNEIWDDIGILVEASQHRPSEPPGVVVVADGRYVRWPQRRHWLDLWSPDSVVFDSNVESSLRITTAIHLQAMLQPLQAVE